MIFKPFRGIRPDADQTGDVVSPPYDVINTAEAVALAEGKPNSFLHVVRPEIDVEEGTSMYADVVYETAAANLKRLMADHVLIQDDAAAFYIYQQCWERHVQTGIVGAAAVDDYDSGKIKKHEHTRQQKEDDRARHVDTTGANTGPVFLTYRAHEGIDELVHEQIQDIPDVEISQANVLHRLWVISDPTLRDQLEKDFNSVEAFYVADGHHRSASGSRARSLRKGRNENHTGDEAYNRFLAVAFPDEQLKILSYNRLVCDLNGLSKDELLAKANENFVVSETTEKVPNACGNFQMFVDGQWYQLSIRPEKVPTEDAVASLDVALLQDYLLAPALGIGDPRTDNRIAFAGGIRGTDYLEAQVNAGNHAVAFSLYPTTIAQLLAVADSGEVMPPKSTWFEPKLLSGLVIHLLDGEGPGENA